MLRLWPASHTTNDTKDLNWNLLLHLLDPCKVALGDMTPQTNFSPLKRMLIYVSRSLPAEQPFFKVTLLNQIFQKMIGLHDSCQPEQSIGGHSREAGFFESFYLVIVEGDHREM